MFYFDKYYLLYKIYTFKARQISFFGKKINVLCQILRIFPKLSVLVLNFSNESLHVAVTFLSSSRRVLELVITPFANQLPAIIVETHFFIQDFYFQN